MKRLTFIMDDGRKITLPVGWVLTAPGPPSGSSLGGSSHPQYLAVSEMHAATIWDDEEAG